MRRIGPFAVPPIGFGCMNLSHGYGHPITAEQGRRILLQALDLGIHHFDTATLYGHGRNEELVGTTLAPHRNEILLASKCVLMIAEDGKRILDGRPEAIRAACDASLKRLKTDVIDLYYLHRLDRAVPIEDSVGAMADLLYQGKIRAIGLSEMSAASLRRAHEVHPIAAMQSEYSLWTRNPEVAVLDACQELGTAFVAFSPIARGFLAGTLLDPDGYAAGDLRLAMPRFQEPHLAKNRTLLADYRRIAEEAGCTMAQLALAWLLQKRDFILPIPGTTNVDHLNENLAAKTVTLSSRAIARLEALINAASVSGPRYSPAAQKDIDTEELPLAV